MNNIECKQYVQWLIEELGHYTIPLFVDYIDQFANHIPYIYFHGDAAFLNDSCQQSDLVSSPEISLPEGIYEVYHYTAQKILHAYIWKSGERLRGLIVDPEDYESNLYAKQKFIEHAPIL